MARALNDADPERYGGVAAEYEGLYEDWEREEEANRARAQEDRLTLETRFIHDGVDPRSGVADLVRNAVEGGAPVDSAFEMIVDPYKASATRSAQETADEAGVVDRNAREAIEVTGGGHVPRVHRQTTDVSQLASRAVERAEGGGGSRRGGDPFTAMFGQDPRE
jgi:hypothetical protein